MCDVVHQPDRTVDLKYGFMRGARGGAYELRFGVSSSTLLYRANSY